MGIFVGGTFSSGGYGFSARVLIMAGVTVLAAFLLPGVHVQSAWAVVLTAIVIAILNNIVRPILWVLTLPISIISSSFSLFVINSLVVRMASGLLGTKFQVDGWLDCFLFGLILTVIDYLVELPSRRRQMRYDNSQRNTESHSQDNDDEDFTPYEEVND